jgi:hypothetical protein
MQLTNRQSCIAQHGLVMLHIAGILLLLFLLESVVCIILKRYHKLVLHYVTCAAVKFKRSSASIMRSSNDIHSGLLVLASVAVAVVSVAACFDQ